MQHQGIADIQHTVPYETLISIEFKVGKHEYSFPIRKKLADLFQRIKRIDEHACLKESLGESVWSDIEDLPAGEDFEAQFRLRKNNSTRNPKITLYCVLRSKMKLGAIKSSRNLLGYLIANHIFINYNAFKTEETGNPGFLIKLHPMFTNKGNMTMSLAGAIKEVDLEYAYEDEDNEQDEENQKKVANLRKDMSAWMKEHHP
eukprot:7167773-Ditylum_brightwellii.AAC.1